MTEFREIKGWPGYFANREGKVASTRRGYFRLLSPSLNSWGYIQYGTSKNGKGTNISGQRAVALAWLPRDSEDLEVNHKNGDKTDNRIENLEWVTKSENQRHKFSHLGATSHLEKLTKDQVLQIRNLLASGKRQKDICNEFKISRSQAHAIATRKCWKFI